MTDEPRNSISIVLVSKSQLGVSNSRQGVGKNPTYTAYSVHIIVYFAALFSTLFKIFLTFSLYSVILFSVVTSEMCCKLNSEIIAKSVEDSKRLFHKCVERQLQ